jgi:hypothetical protein
MGTTSEVIAGRVGRGGWARVSKSEPCEVCDSPDWCSRSASVTCCMRVKSDVPMKNGGWLHKIGTTLIRAKPRPPERRISDSELQVRFGPQCKAWYVGQNAKIAELSKVLGVSPWALDDLHVGWDGAAWTFPETNHHGQIIGVNRRLLDGKKIMVVGSRRGLTFVEDWADAYGPIFVVEGGSDVAAGLTLGLCVIGRPSNTGGVEYLVRLLGKYDRKVILLAERDEKDRTAMDRHDPDCRCCGQCYPGKFGAVETANRLSSRLGKIVHWSFLPDDKKDLRAWLNSRGANPMNQTAMKRIAGSLIRRTINGIKE